METNTSFTEGKILKPLILFAFPVLLALFLQAMYGAVDLLIVGKFASSADVSAVSTGSQIMTTLTNLISSFAMGTTILLGQQIGSGKKAKKKKPDELDMAQISLFDTVRDDDIIEEIREMNLGNLTPIDALNKLYELQNKIKNRW